MLENLIHRIDENKKKLDSLRPLPPELLKNLNEWMRIELTFTSNALEGNTLTERETALVVEKGITIGGKSVREHLEAINHAFALDYIKELATKNRQEITLNDIRDIHRLILNGIDDAHVGRLRTVPVFIAGSSFKLPDPIRVPDLMRNFIDWLHSTDDHPLIIAAQAHFRIVAIHPFVDGNGRTARLVMNLLLLQAGYPPAIIPVDERMAYITSIAKAETEDQFSDFYTLIFHAVERSLDMYLDAAKKVLR